MLGSIWGSHCLGKLPPVSGFGSKGGRLGVGPKRFEAQSDQRMCFGGCVGQRCYSFGHFWLIYLLYSCSQILNPKSVDDIVYYLVLLGLLSGCFNYTPPEVNRIRKAPKS